MRTLIVLLLLISLADAPVRSQNILPNLPGADYAVFTETLNYLSFCDRPDMVHRRGELLLLRAVTETQTKYGFSTNFVTDQRNLSFLLGPDSAFCAEPEWASFLVSVDSTRFAAHQLQRSLTLACRESQVMSQQQYDDYFGAPRAEGHWGLSKKYPNYGGVVSFSTVAYSPDRTRAVCYCSIVSDSRAGAGNLIFLERRNEHWIVVGRAVLWVA